MAYSATTLSATVATVADNVNSNGNTPVQEEMDRSSLLQCRIVLINGDINDATANDVISQLLLLGHNESAGDITIHINSPGGSMTAISAIIDTMRHLKPDVATVCIGMAASMSAILLSCGAKGKRTAVPNSRIMINQGSASFQGTPLEIADQAREVLRVKKKLIEILAENCGRDIDQITKDIDRDYWMTAEEAVAYGIIDNVMTDEEAATYGTIDDVWNQNQQPRSLLRGIANWIELYRAFRQNR